MVLTDAVVEAAAKAAYAVRSESYGGFAHTWEQIGEYRRACYIREAKATIEAALELM